MNRHNAAHQLDLDNQATISRRAGHRTLSKHLHCAQAAEPLATGKANNFRFDVNDKPARQAASLGTRAGFIRAYFSNTWPMMPNIKELLLGTAMLAGLFSSAYANDKEVVGDVARGVSGGDLCNLAINTKAAAKYLNDELQNRTITVSVLADYIEAASKAVEILSSVKDDINCEKVLGMYGPNGVVIPGLLEPK